MSLDVDPNGIPDAATDGILIIRYLFDFRGDALVDGAIGQAATRTSGPDVAAFLDGFLPSLVVPSSAPLAPVALAKGTDFGTEQSMPMGFMVLQSVEDDDTWFPDGDGVVPADELLSLNVDVDPLLLGQKFEPQIDWLNLV